MDRVRGQRIRGAEYSAIMNKLKRQNIVGRSAFKDKVTCDHEEEKE